MLVVSNDYGIPHKPDRYQAVLNQSWPAAGVARRLHDRPDALEVRVRIVFERDGQCWLHGRATRWWQQHVCVYVRDNRLRVPYVWVGTEDVKRR